MTDTTEHPPPSAEYIAQVEAQWRKLIASRVPEKSYEKVKLLEPQIKFPCPKDYYLPVDGFYGGFTAHWKWSEENSQWELISSSWCRVAGGSERTHRVSPQGFEVIRSAEDTY